MQVTINSGKASKTNYFKYPQKDENTTAVFQKPKNTNNTNTMPDFNRLGALTYLATGKKSDSIAFSANRPHKTSNFEICTLEDLPCPACGGKILTKGQFETFKTKLDEVPENKYLQVISKYKKYMRPTEAYVFVQAEKVGKQNPDMTLSEIISQLRAEKLPPLEAVQLNILTSIEGAVKKFPMKEKHRILFEVKRSIETIQARETLDSKKTFKRKKFLDALQSIRIVKPENKSAVMRLANQLPTSGESECAWIVKYSGKDSYGNQRSSREIAERFLVDSVVNVDHLVAVDLDGEDKILNYVAMHTGCNEDKTNKPILVWIEEDPERPTYLSDYLTSVQSAINAGKIDNPRYNDYPVEVAQRIENLSGRSVIYV